MSSCTGTYRCLPTHEKPSYASGEQVGCIRFALLFSIFLAVPVFSLWTTFTASAGNVRGIKIGHPPGKLIDIGTHRLHLYCAGKGSPTVILDAGLGGSSLEWWTVQQKLAV